jgi:hypothetical protein
MVPNKQAEGKRTSANHVRSCGLAGRRAQWSIRNDDRYSQVFSIERKDIEGIELHHVIVLTAVQAIEVALLYRSSDQN